MARVLPAVIAAIVLMLGSSAEALVLAPGTAAGWRVHARRGDELAIRARARRCTRLAVGVDGRQSIVVRVGSRLADHRVVGLAAGWHRIVIRAARAGCRSEIEIERVEAVSPVRARPTTPPQAGAPQPTRPSPGTPAGTPAPGTSGAGGGSGAGTGPGAGGDRNPFAGASFYVDPNSNAAQTEATWRSAGLIADADAIAKIAANPQAQWFGDWNGADPSADVRDAVGRAAAVGALPVLVAYNIPGRDCGGYSAGGADSADAYRTWIEGFASGISNASAVVILEPDAIPELDCMSTADQQTTLALLAFAVQTLGANPGTAVYLDAGDSGWQPPAVIASRLGAADVAQARGFSLNVSNFDSTASEEAYGDSISALTGGKHFVVDTSRNGQGPAANGEWCNPPGRGLGQPATAATGDPLADALFWIKAPGESDGTCNGGPAAGVWWPDYVLGLAQRASF